MIRLGSNVRDSQARLNSLHAIARILCKAQNSGHRGAQVMGGIGDEAALRHERGFQPGEHGIEGEREFLDLIMCRGHWNPSLQITPGLHMCGKMCQAAHRGKCASREPVTASYS